MGMKAAALSMGPAFEVYSWQEPRAYYNMILDGCVAGTRYLLVERGLEIDHTTIWRWVQRYAPELEERARPHLKATNKSWRVDETYVSVRACGPRKLMKNLNVRAAKRICANSSGFNTSRVLTTGFSTLSFRAVGPRKLMKMVSS
jgi:hypothetical protein